MHNATAPDFFVLAASSMVLLGLLSASSVVLTRWGPNDRAVVPARPVLSGVVD
jgi:MATE family, multidrug efflux pump